MADVPANTMKAGKNLVIDRVRGHLMEREGYGVKYSSLPQSTGAKQLIVSTYFKEFSTVVFPEHGSKEITVQLTQQSKQSFEFLPDEAGMGVWIRPYWDGSIWNDDWKELTEYYNFKIDSRDLGTGKMYLDDFSSGTFDFGAIFGEDYFNGWTVWNKDEDQYVTVKDSGTDGTGYFLQVEGASVLSLWVGDIIYVMYQYLGRDTITRFQAGSQGPLPVTGIEPFHYRINDGVRISQGNRTTDFLLRVTHVEQQFFNQSGIFNIDRDVVGLQSIVVDTTAVQLTFFSYGAGSLPSAQWHLKFSVVIDGQKSNLSADLALGTGSGSINGNLDVHFAQIPREATEVEIYASDDNLFWYYIKTISLNASSGWSQFGSGFFRFALTITNTEWNNRGIEASTNIGRALVDRGDAKYKHAVLLGDNVFLADVLSNSVARPNVVATNGRGGDGAEFVDVFPNDALHLINVDLDDGDKVKAVSATPEFLLVHKNRTTILMEPVTPFTFRSVSKNVGITNYKSIAGDLDLVAWFDHNGIYVYGTGRFDNIAGAFLEEWRNLSDAVKDAAIATFDLKFRRYMVFFNGTVRAFNVDENEWMEFSYADTHQHLFQRSDGQIDSFVTNKILSFDGSRLDNGQAVVCEFETNPFRAPGGRGLDALLDRLGIEYSSTVDLTLEVFLDNDTALFGTAATLDKAKTEDLVLFQGSGICKMFRLKFKGTIALATDTIEIKTPIDTYFEVVPAFGDVMAR